MYKRFSTVYNYVPTSAFGFVPQNSAHSKAPKSVMHMHQMVETAAQ